MDYFFFGTLRDPEVLALVIGREVGGEDIQPAALDGRRLARIHEESYPALVADPDGRVAGIVVRGLSAAEAGRLAWFEGKEYVPRIVEVTPDRGGRPIAALIQTPTGTLEPEIVDEAWDFATWQMREKSRLMTLTRAHMALYGQVDIDEAIRRWDEVRERLEATNAPIASGT